GWASSALLLMTLCYASRAHAQYARPVFVRVSTGGPAFTVSVRQRRHVPAQQLAACEQACGFWAYPGKYVVRMDLPEQDASVTLRVRGPGNYDFVPGNSAARSAGLVLGIVGPVAVTVGAVMVIAGAYNSRCDDAVDRPTSCNTPAISYYGAATFLAGVGMTTAGWVLYVANRPRFQLNELGPLQPASARLGLIPMPRGGLGFGATVAF
ncbi:MAG: hypothetical protein ABI488_12860, partial [Polyangiaceae bacterium]